ncbi:hypothetical protein ABZ820_30460 [Streptomyces diacarni]|uniref:hypothetical protein n=1 Tax=Streptomyces diacarni TaxID=2800381 RepID=UPI00340E5658
MIREVHRFQPVEREAPGQPGVHGIGEPAVFFRPHPGTTGEEEPSSAPAQDGTPSLVMPGP